jgi:hypothetical protein
MADLNWGMIENGGTFESLMHAILYAEDPNIILFGRKGPDAGQDARSLDGKCIYQAKHRSSLNMDGAIKLALSELDTIKKYRSPKHQNYCHWKDTERWVLYANISKNSNDFKKWENEVVPIFRNEGISPTYIDIPSIEGMLIDQPHILDVFFHGKNRVLIGLKEAYLRLRDERLGSSSLDVEFVSRVDEIKTIIDFSKSKEKRILPVTGSCGIGKTRFLYEALHTLAQDGWRVYWGLTYSMARNSQLVLLSTISKACRSLPTRLPDQ